MAEKSDHTCSIKSSWPLFANDGNLAKNHTLARFLELAITGCHRKADQQLASPQPQRLMWSTLVAAARQLLLYACRVLIPGQAASCLVQLISNNTQSMTRRPTQPTKRCLNDPTLFCFCRLSVENCEEHMAEKSDHTCSIKSSWPLFANDGNLAKNHTLARFLELAITGCHRKAGQQLASPQPQRLMWSTRIAAARQLLLYACRVCLNPRTGATRPKQALRLLCPNPSKQCPPNT